VTRLTAENTAIVLDSTADFPDGPARFPNWRIVPLYVRFGDESFRDYVELSPADFYARLRTASRLPTTSQPTPADFLSCYEDLAGYERVLSLHIASDFSGTVESARRAADEVGGGRVRVFDTRTASAGIALLTLAVQRRLDRGTTDDEVDAVIGRLARDLRVVFTVDTLEYLARGGRIGRARAWAGEVLSVKPILAIADGEIVPIKRVRGNRKAFMEFVRAFEESSVDRRSLRIGIAHADAPEREEALRELVRRARPSAQLEVATTLGAVVGAHAGPGTVGFFWVDDSG
jgi:DegV family protein with EDD domain